MQLVWTNVIWSLQCVVKTAKIGKKKDWIDFLKGKLGVGNRIKNRYNKRHLPLSFLIVRSAYEIMSGGGNSVLCSSGGQDMASRIQEFRWGTTKINVRVRKPLAVRCFRYVNDSNVAIRIYLHLVEEIGNPMLLKWCKIQSRHGVTVTSRCRVTLLCQGLDPISFRHERRRKSTGYLNHNHASELDPKMSGLVNIVRSCQPITTIND